MPRGLTRREFLKAGAAAGAACTLPALSITRQASAATTVELDGNEMVARVGDTFATIQLVPRYSKSATPETILAKVQYSTDPTFSTYAETAEVSAAYFVRSEGGKHVGPDGSADLKVSRKYKFIKGQWEIEPGDFIFNETDGSTMVVSRVVNNQTIAGTLSGGVDNCWNTYDKWRIDRTFYRFELNLTGLAASTRYYYRVLLRYEGDPWPAPRATHSFRTRRAPGQTFRFAVWADPHRTLTKRGELDPVQWGAWDSTVARMKTENVDFVFDIGDTWYMCNGHGKPHFKFMPELYAMTMRPTRNGVGGYRGVSDVCADCGYYLARGNHEGVSDYDKPGNGRLLRDLLRLYVPNPTGNTYPQGGSRDEDYNQGYFAFEWGDALFIALDCVKYKELRGDEARFHIGQAQLDWLANVLQGSTRRWKFIFFHHLFGGGNDYGRGGAVFASAHEHAQVQALAEQHGAVIFKGHDHLLASEWANTALYYTCGSPCIGRDYKWAPSLYPNGYLPLRCNESPPACENNGYVVVEVTATQVTIQYKSHLGHVVDTTVLT